MYVLKLHQSVAFEELQDMEEETLTGSGSSSSSSSSSSEGSNSSLDTDNEIHSDADELQQNDTNHGKNGKEALTELCRSKLLYNYH